MQLLNFVLGSQYIDLQWPNGGYADLHNDYNFTQLNYLPSEAKLTLSWQKSSEEWARKASAQALHLVFEEVNYLQVKERDQAYRLSEDTCLRDICRTPHEVRTDFDSVWESKDPPSEYDLQSVFQSDWGIKVNADTVRLLLES